MAKLVYGYVTKLEVAMKECDKEIGNMGTKNSVLNDGGVKSDISKYPNDKSNIYFR